jgi:predicted ATPase
LAGQQALQRSANAAAISHLTNGLELVRTLPNPGERNQQELALHIALGSVLVATEGYTTPAVKNVYTRARELCGGADIAQLFSVLNGLRRFHYLRAEFGKARELAGQLLNLAENGDDPALHVLAHQAVGVVSYSLAELASAREHLQRAPTLYDARQHRFHTVFYGEDPSVIAMSFESSVLWLLGYPDEALAKIRQALKLAEELAHPLSLALALNFAAWLYQLRGDEAALRDSLGRASTLSSEQGLPNWLAQSKILAGWMQSGQGRREEGIAQMREGLADYRATGAMLTATYFLALLAEAHARTGSPAQGLLVLSEALDLVNANGERFYEAELYRLRGELILQQAKTEAGQNYVDSMRCPATVEAEAENCFRKAVDVASAQQAKSLELRAVMSLSHLRCRQSSKAEARQILENIYGWFTEGLGTADLNSAAAILHGLAS